MRAALEEKPAEPRVRAARAGAGCGRLLAPGAPGQVRGRPLTGPGATPASCRAVRSPRPSPSSSRLPPERWARLVPAWGSGFFSPRETGLRQVSPGREGSPCELSPPRTRRALGVIGFGVEAARVLWEQLVLGTVR